MSNIISYIITQEEIDIKTYLRKHLGISAKALTKLKSSGIFLNGEHATVRKIMKKGDQLSIVPETENETNYTPEDIPLDIIYDDENFLIINKPCQMAVYPAGVHMTGSVLNAFSFHYPKKTFRPIYRLDRNTSGIICIAKNKIASVSRIEKEYIAICHGVTAEHLYIDKEITLCENSRIKRCVGIGQKAQTEFFKLSSDDEYSLLKVKIYTGRTHQIRVHLANEGYPLAGDILYGGKTNCIQRHALHCHKITIENKALNFKKEFIANLPEDMQINFKDLFKEK